MFATGVGKEYSLMKYIIENISKINSFTTCMLRNIAHLAMKNTEMIYY